MHFGVTANPTADWVAQQITEAFPWDTSPRYMIRDQDCVYGAAVRAKVKAMDIEEVVTAPPLALAEPLCREGNRID